MTKEERTEFEKRLAHKIYIPVSYTHLTLPTN